MATKGKGARDGRTTSLRRMRLRLPCCTNGPKSYAESGGPRRRRPTNRKMAAKRKGAFDLRRSRNVYEAFFVLPSPFTEIDIYGTLIPLCSADIVV